MPTTVAAVATSNSNTVVVPKIVPTTATATARYEELDDSHKSRPISSFTLVASKIDGETDAERLKHAMAKTTVRRRDTHDLITLVNIRM